MKEEFEDTKGVIIIRILKKNRQNTAQEKKYKRTNNDLQNIFILKGDALKVIESYVLNKGNMNIPGLWSTVQVLGYFLIFRCVS